MNKEIKRRANIVQIVPNNPAVVRLVGAVLAEQHYDWATHRHYLTEHSMARLYPTHGIDTTSDAPGYPISRPRSSLARVPGLVAGRSQLNTVALSRPPTQVCAAPGFQPYRIGSCCQW